MHELFNESPFLNVKKPNSFLCTVYGAYKDFGVGWHNGHQATLLG